MITTKTKILIVPGYRLFPCETGAGVAQFNFIEALRHRVNLSVLLSPSNVSNDNLKELQNSWENVQFLFWEKPEYVPVIPSLKERLVGKISRTFKRVDEEDIVRSPKYQQIHYNIENILLDAPKWMQDQLNNLLLEQSFDLIQFDLPINMALAETVAGRAKTIFIHHEIKFQRIETMITGLEEDFNALTQLKKEVERKELLHLNKFDAIQVFHDNDAQLLKGKVNKPIHVSPFSVDDNVYRTPDRAEKLEKIIFIGSDEHIPNLDGLDWFYNQIMELGEDKLKLKVHVIGKWSQGNKDKYSADWLIFEGFVHDLTTWFANSVLIAPIRLGSGLRTKIMEAMAASMPIISTKFACQGINYEQAGIILAENAVEILNCIDFLTLDSQEYRSLQKKVNVYAVDNFSSKQIVDKRLKIFDQTLTFFDE